MCHSPQRICKPSQIPVKLRQKYMKRILNLILLIQVYVRLSFSHVFKHFSVPPRFLKKLRRIMTCDVGMTETTPLILVKFQQKFPLPLPLLQLKAVSIFSAQYRLVKTRFATTVSPSKVSRVQPYPTHGKSHLSISDLLICYYLTLYLDSFLTLSEYGNSVILLSEVFLIVKSSKLQAAYRNS